MVILHDILLDVISFLHGGHHLQCEGDLLGHCRARHDVSTAFITSSADTESDATGIRLYHMMDRATASSIYSGDSRGLLDTQSGSTFTADQALTPDADTYWKSSGDDPIQKPIIWKAYSDSRFPALGLKVEWALSPSWVKLAYSPDGKHFQTAMDWHPEDPRDGRSYTQDLLFDTSKNVKAVEILMKGGLPWKAVGIKHAALIASKPIVPSGAKEGATHEAKDVSTKSDSASPNPLFASLQ